MARGTASKSVARKGLPAWVPVVVIIAVLAIIAVIYVVVGKNKSDRPADTPEFKKMMSGIEERAAKDPAYFATMRRKAQEELVKKGVVPKEWLDQTPTNATGETLRSGRMSRGGR